MADLQGRELGLGLCVCTGACAGRGLGGGSGLVIRKAWSAPIKTGTGAGAAVDSVAARAWLVFWGRGSELQSTSTAAFTVPGFLSAASGEDTDPSSLCQRNVS